MSRQNKKWYKTGWGIIFILCFWPFIVAYYVIKYVIKISNDQATKKSQTAQASYEPIDNEKDYAAGMSVLSKSDKYESSIKNHLSKLTNFYREHSAEYSKSEKPVVKIINNLYPSADGHICPSCGVIHDFSASRARKCPDCGNQMVVRQGIFLSEDQADIIDKKTTEYYDKTYWMGQIKNVIDRIQSYAKRGNYGEAFLMIAEGYQTCAIIHNKRYEKGYSAWDYAWGVLNNEAMDVSMAGALDAKSMVGNGYADVIFARGKHCLKELKYSETSSAMNKFAKMAIDMFYIYLLELESVDLSSWHQEDAIKNIHIAKILGGVSDSEIKDIQSRLLDHASTKPSSDVLDKVVREVDEYVFLETDQERLKQFIY